MNRAHQQGRPQSPPTLGRYRIRGVLGEGGMGRLYVAEQTGIEGFTKIVAVKRILPHLADSLSFRTLFLNEARIAARLEHPNIVATYELGAVEGTYFIAMEYLPGEDLSAILARCEAPAAMPVEVAALLAQQSANGLHYAHQLRDADGKPAGLVHRDVNPSNIFVTYHGMVKLLDFGVVKAEAAGNIATGPGVFKGKYAYCAPEQLRGETVDHRSDVFSLGIVLWECLTGHRLFESATDAGTIDAVRGQEIVAPSLLQPEIPIQLDEITMRALVRDRKRRYQSALELSEALDRFLGGQRVRPTTNRVGQWLESLFGSERAALKRAIAQGNDVEAALARLTPAEPKDRAAFTPPPTSRAAVKPRPLWSTGLDRDTTAPASQALVPAPQGGLPLAAAVLPEAEVTRAAPPPEMIPDPPPPRKTIPVRPARPTLFQPWLVMGSVAALVVVVVGTAAWLARPARRAGQSMPARSAAPSASQGTGVLDIDSEPAGANILVDGDPSGLTTPATLRDLPIGRTVDIRLDKTGYAPVSRQMEVQAGEPRRQLFRLVEAVGTVKLEGVPAGAAVYVDDMPADTRRSFALALGPHRLRVEGEADVFFSATVEVRAGQQVITVPSRRPR